MDKALTEHKLRLLDATDERQYMLNDRYEVYEKQGAPLGAVTLHYHNFYEIIYVLEGEYSSMIENRTYHLHKGDFLLINQNAMHKYHFEEKKHDSSKRIILWITEQMLRELSKQEMELSACFGTGPACAYHFPVYYEEMLRGYLLKLAMANVLEGEIEGTKEVMDRGYLTLFFGYLNNLCIRREYWFRDGVVKHPLVEKVSTYIEQNIAQQILVEDLAEQVHMSKYYFLRKFKELTGVTVHAFLTDKRLIKACELLKKGENISTVYHMCGFSDYSSFLRNFKATFGVAPGKYTDFYQ